MNDTVKSYGRSDRINRYLYILFLILAAYMLATKDYEQAASNMAIALIFDPFDASVAWKDRPRYQKVWLCVHLLVTVAGFGSLVYLHFTK